MKEDSSKSKNEIGTAEEFALKKSIVKKLSALEEKLKGRGLKEDGVNYYLAKIARLLKNQNETFVPLEKIGIETFGKESGGVRTNGGFIIFKNKDRFMLYRARTTKKLYNGEGEDKKQDKKLLQKNVNAMLKKFYEENGGSPTKLDKEKMLDDIPLLKETTLNKSDIQEELYLFAKSDERTRMILETHTGSEKITKALIKSIPIGEIQYLIESNDRFKDTRLKKIFDHYILQEQKTSLMLKPKTTISTSDVATAGKKSPVLDILKKYEKIAEEQEKEVCDLLEKLSAINDIPKEQRTEAVIEHLFKMSQKGKEIKDIVSKFEKEICDPSSENLTKIIFQVSEDSTLPVSIKNEEEIGCVSDEKDIPHDLKKIAMMTEREMFSEENIEKTAPFLEKLGVRTVEKETIYNYGVFGGDGVKTERALNNVLIYVKSMEEYIGGNDKEKARSKEIKTEQSPAF